MSLKSFQMISLLKKSHTRKYFGSLNFTKTVPKVQKYIHSSSLEKIEKIKLGKKLGIGNMFI